MSDFAVSRAVARGWWILALRGVAALLLGLALIALPGLTLLLLVIWISAFMVVDGVLALIAGGRAIVHHRHGAALLLEGALGVAIGAILFLWPGVGIGAIVGLAAIWAILTGVALLWGATSLPVVHGRWLMGAVAVISLIWGVLLIVHPLAGALALALWFGAYALASGAAMLFLAFRLRSAHPAA